MVPSNPLFIVFSLLHFSLTALGQQISLITPAVVQCAQVPVQWSGGVGPFEVVIATTSDANGSSVEVIPNVANPPYVWDEDLAAGTPFTISIRDSSVNSAETPPITVQASTNTSCLDDSTDVPPSVSSHTGHPSKALSTNIHATSATSATSTGLSETGSPNLNNSQKSSRNSHVPIIAGAVVGLLVLLSVIVILIALQRRKDRRRHTSSKEELVRTFGSAKADLDGPEDHDVDDMAIPEPYVYRNTSRAQTTDLAALETEDLHRNRTTTRRSPAELPNIPPATLPSRKGERYLPNYASSPMDTRPGGASQSRIQEEDIDRLAARMVAMMSAGRLADQAWAPGAPRTKDAELGDEARVPPPQYKDVARRTSGQHPSGGRY